MKNIKFFFGLRNLNIGLCNTTIYITPTIYSTLSNSIFESKHSFSIEFQWISFGIGIMFNWQNKKVEPYPDLSFLDNTKHTDECDHYYPFTNTGRILPCEFCGDVKKDKSESDADTDHNEDEDYDDSYECCDTCGCYHGHHSWCRE